MRVLFFQGFVDPQRRGSHDLLEAWPTLPGVAGGVARAGAGVQAVVAAHSDEVLEVDGVTYRFVREGAIPSPRRLLGHRAAPHPRRSLRTAQALPADVVHLHGLSFPLQVRALRRGHPRSVVFAQDHADRPPRGWRRPLHRWGHRGLDGVAFTARAMADPFLETGVLSADTAVFEVLEGSSVFEPGDRQMQRRRWGMDTPTVAWVGNLAEGKDPMAALTAFRGLLDAVPEATLHMVFRGGALEDAVRSRIIGDRRLSKRVRLVGGVPHADMAAFLGGSDVLLAPSRREGSGYALIEALACGTPAVATSIPAHRAILGEGHAGCLVPSGDADAMAAALGRMLQETGDGRRRAARARFEASLTFDAIGRTLVAAYETLRARRGDGTVEAGP